MPRRPKTPWVPSPEFQAAYERVRKTAHYAAAALTGDEVTDDPDKDAAQVTILFMLAMIYFLCRIDPRDIEMLYAREGGFGELDFKPFPAGYTPGKGPFAEFFR
ncbi:hypothetical protein [Parvibaculum sp.]|uniref:hypothetical protein n=1 Tax=Parvibaculum sp. TaxID=2024848 RepID=UPI003BAD5598